MIFLKVNLSRNTTSLFHLPLVPMRCVNGCWSQYLPKLLLESNIILTVVDVNSLTVSSKVHTALDDGQDTEVQTPQLPPLAKMRK